MSDFFVTPWTVARQAPLSMGFPRQEYWSGLPFPSPKESSRPKDQTRISCLVGRFSTTEPSGKSMGYVSQEFLNCFFILFLIG